MNKIICCTIDYLSKLFIGINYHDMVEDFDNGEIFVRTCERCGTQKLSYYLGYHKDNLSKQSIDYLKSEKYGQKT